MTFRVRVGWFGFGFGSGLGLDAEFELGLGRVRAKTPALYPPNIAKEMILSS